jgi:hypothetical protein
MTVTARDAACRVDVPAIDMDQVDQRALSGHMFGTSVHMLEPRSPRNGEMSDGS